jgi:hypothetical protein
MPKLQPRAGICFFLMQNLTCDRHAGRWRRCDFTDEMRAKYLDLEVDCQRTAATLQAQQQQDINLMLAEQALARTADQAAGQTAY